MKDTSSHKKQPKKALGKGLGALLGDIDTFENSARDYFLCDVTTITPNRYQPRIKFSEKELEELADSIREQGIIQPLLVRTDDTGYELIAGERRLRAARMAGLEKVPVVVRNISDGELLEMSIVENIQRENFTPMEEAEAYSRLLNEFNLTQEDVAKRVGKSRPSVANYLRLLKLPEPIKASISDGSLSMGHARAILGAENSAEQQLVWQTILAKGLSVRQTEALIKQLKSKKELTEKPKPQPTVNEPYVSDLINDLARHFGTRVQIKQKGKKGVIAIEFYGDDDLNRLVQLLRMENQSHDTIV